MLKKMRLSDWSALGPPRKATNSFTKVLTARLRSCVRKIEAVEFQ